MRKLLSAGIFLFLFFPAWAEEVIVIEMHGDPTPTATAPSVWEKNAQEISRQMRGTTREHLLYTMPVVSDKDRMVGNSSAEYALVEYYKDGKFRKFLFKAEYPQPFITAAATAKDVLAVNKKYGINIGLSLKDFQESYASRALEEKNPLLPATTALYKLPYQDINTPKATDRWFLFEKEQLTLTFENSTEKEAYLTSLQPQKEEPKAKPTPKPVQKKRQRTVRKALVSGGTLHDRMYMPRVINPKTVPPTMTLNNPKNTDN